MFGVQIRFEKIEFTETFANASHRLVSMHLLQVRMQFHRIDSFAFVKYAYE